MVVDQLKKRANASMKDHFLDSWANLKSATQIAELFDNYEDVRKGSVNGHEIDILRDTGATIDLVCAKYVNPSSFSGENVWVKQPLSPELVCLPLAVVEISGNFGTVQTKAAVCGNHLNQHGRYLLGNKMAELIKGNLGYNFLPVEILNAVQTRSQFKAAREERGIDSGDAKKEEDEVIIVSSDAEDEILIPALQEYVPELALLRVTRENLINAQKNSEEIKSLYEQAASQVQVTNQVYSLEKELLVRIREDKLGNVVKLIVVPEELRDPIKSLCHEGTSAHLGITKSKDKLNRYFYWPNCYRDMEQFVKTCDQCQRAGKPNDKKKAPLKLVPVIQEVFTKLNIDACGPLPITSKGNRYLITAICMSSKFPEAIPVSDISSVSVTDALLNIFSRMGFPVKYNVTRSNPVERFHRTLKRLLRVLCLDAGSEWNKHLPSILLALRTVSHESTGYTPSELVYGKNLRTPEMLVMEHWMEPEEEGDLVTEYMFKLINRLKRCQEVAINKMEEMQVKRKTWYDKNAVKREFKDGDFVLVLATSIANKLAVQWIGPGTILNKISETNYLVEIPGRRETSQIYHINMLKPYYKRPEHVNVIINDETKNSLADQELEIPYLENNSLVYDFEDVIQASELNKHLHDKQMDRLRELLSEYSKCFSNNPGLTNLVEHEIQLVSDQPVRTKPYRMSHRQNEILKNEINRMLKLGIIEVGESDYMSPMILVEVAGKEPRPCIDYRKLNGIIRTEYFPLPNIEERVEKVSVAKFITVLDLSKGYWQIPLSKTAQRYAAFCTSFGTYRPLRMSFGLKNAPYFFSKLMAELLNGLEDFVVPYLDDIAIFSDTWESPIKHMEMVLQRIKRAKLTIKPSKCKFAQQNVKFLGHIMGQGFRTPSEIKVQAVLEFPTPRTKTQIRAFLGLAGYYQKYINLFSVIATPLTDALKGRAKKGEITWTTECENAFRELKGKLIDKPVLYAPNFEREFIVQTDASNAGMGAVLSQLTKQGEEHPILYLSKKFSEVEKRYCMTKKECASIVFAIKRLHYYLDGNSFLVMTDHNPLVWLNRNVSSNPRLMRWALALQPYNFRIVHRSGKSHKNADSLSRSVIDN
ncbi:retrovirus-related Pol polyprotein from transposon 297 [Trichonephila clavipes]|nr:retrovirus-related Pol polyprotein from transposon 297 [Trichonephila clavipes]